MMEAVHAEICPGSALISARRALFAMAADILAVASGVESPDLTADAVLDSPRLRFAVGQALRGTGVVDPRLSVRVQEVAENCRPLPVLESMLLATGPGINEAVPEAAAYLGLADEVSPFMHGASAEFDDAVEAVNGGVDLALTVSPGLAADLLAHVTVCAILDTRAAATIRSGSLREMGGLIAISSTDRTVDVAEMILHEAAHQKVFDFMLVGSFVDQPENMSGSFVPDWHRSSAVAWPIAQTLAAFHAYACLAEFAADLRNSAWAPRDYSAQSLLPHASARRDAIGAWLIDHLGKVGHDAQYLISRVLGRVPPPRPGVTPANGLDLAAIRAVAAPNIRLELGASSQHALVGKGTEPPVFFFLDLASGLALSRLTRFTNATALSGELMQSLALSEERAARLTSRIIQDLGALGLVHVEAGNNRVTSSVG